MSAHEGLALQGIAARRLLWAGSRPLVGGSRLRTGSIFKDRAGGPSRTRSVSLGPSSPPASNGPSPPPAWPPPGTLPHRRRADLEAREALSPGHAQPLLCVLGQPYPFSHPLPHTPSQARVGVRAAAGAGGTRGGPNPSSGPGRCALCALLRPFPGKTPQTPRRLIAVRGRCGTEPLCRWSN